MVFRIRILSSAIVFRWCKVLQLVRSAPGQLAELAIHTAANFSDTHDMVFVNLPLANSSLEWIDLPCETSQSNSASQSVASFKGLIEKRYSIPIDEQRIVLNGGYLLSDEDTIENGMCIHVLLRLRGGKGGFGTNLRAMGGKMSKKKMQNKDSCRDIHGRRIRAVKEAEKQQELEVQRVEWEKKKSEQRDKKIKDGLKEPEQKKVLFDDTEYLEAHDKAREDVKDAVKKGEFGLFDRLTI